jgi:glycerol-3-phosphate dehydrogenase
MDSFSAANRPVILDQMQQTHFDLLIIGGGITGAGIALDAVTRGLRVALVEMQDFAGGTSGRSTKLIHGGLRYLKQLEFRLVAEKRKSHYPSQRSASYVTRKNAAADRQKRITRKIFRTPRYDDL